VFCDTYSNFTGFGRIFAILVSPLTSPLLIYVYRTYIIDISMPRTMQLPSCPLLPPFPPSEHPPQHPGDFISHFLLYRNVLIVK
jgi:hypothetical protein